MKYGVRNSMKATVTKVKKGDVMSQISCKIAEPAAMTSILSTDSLEDLNLKEGDQVVLLVKAIHVIPAKE